MTSLQEKAAFFDQLSPLYSDDEFDAEEQTERKRCRNFFTTKPAPVAPVREEPTVLDLTEDEPPNPKTRRNPRRVASAPTPAPSGSSRIIKGTPMANFARKGRLRSLMNAPSADVILVDDTPIPESTRPAQRSLVRTTSTPALISRRSTIGRAGEDSPSPSMALKKRKRETSFKLRPENKQIFQGLAFFYVPDNDIAPARRLRITKAREFGATWTRNVGNATHVVVEKNISFKDVEGIMQRANRAAPPRVVNEDYPIDCIQFKALLQCNQKKYQLAGQPLVEDGKPVPLAPTSSDESATSLQLKPPHINPKRRDYVPPKSTPTRSEEASQQSRVAGTPILVDSQPIVFDLEEIVASPGEDENGIEIGSGSANNEAPTTENANESVRPQFATRQTSISCQEHKDELTDYITLLQELKGIPLDVEDDDGHSVLDTTEGASDEIEDLGSEDERAKRRRVAQKKMRSGRKEMTFQERFACNSAGAKDARAGNPNTRTIEVLQLMADYYNRVNDHWRTTAYRRAISTLKRQNARVTTEEEAFRLPGIGRRLAQKIEEIVMTDRLRRLEYAQDDPMDESLQLFLGIYGVGTSQAQQWIAQGFRTLEDVREKAKLTTNQIVGIDHYADLNTRIPRREVEALGAVVKSAARRLNDQVQLIIGGSYRRGAESSGDIDFIVTRPNTESSGELKPFLDELVQRLEAEQFLVARLASSRSGNDGSKWHGCCVLPKIDGFNDKDYKPTWRRIDFLLVPESEMGAALLYFTGNDIFNRSMRLLASKKGMRLNQRGLYKDVMRGPQRVKVTEGELVEGRDERRIFEILGVKWREPHERWC
ncbi:hypothetical protein B0T10DRAFT_473429 [Thelonectria olida]|uniref:DNA polymerase lambda n=1 Tax=Thelonectria olida TaxID=1576542 RepID=A0A9P8WEE1_9HYPO|nr:hypothetical protein B0T10DRAFT_473429 [Thelonectria olida]